MKADKIEEKIEIIDGVTAKVEPRKVILTGSKGELNREIKSLRVKIELKDNNIILTSKKPTKRELKVIGSFKAHIKNMIKGVTEGHKYTLKICSGHFPMNVALSGSELSVKNFLGEKIPRILKIKEGVTVKVNGTEITVEGINKEVTSQTAASIEQMCRISNKDKRIFQDGIYITNKDGKDIK